MPAVISCAASIPPVAPALRILCPILRKNVSAFMSPLMASANLLRPGILSILANGSASNTPMPIPFSSARPSCSFETSKPAFLASLTLWLASPAPAAMPRAVPPINVAAVAETGAKSANTAGVKNAPIEPRPDPIRYSISSRLAVSYLVASLASSIICSIFRSASSGSREAAPSAAVKPVPR